jgi:uncharacterized Zn finger protein (UPF0148 family)
MSDTVINISIPTDNDGFITLQCPFCSDKFKLTGEDFKAENLTHLFCPYCGLQDESNNFLSDEIMEQIEIAVENYAKSMINNWSNNLEQSLKSSKHISLKRGKLLKMEEDKVLFETEELDIAELFCCQLVIKVTPGAKLVNIYCPFCGLN